MFVFVELLVDDDIVLNYINFFDRMVEDVDCIFEENYLSVIMQMLMNNRFFELLYVIGWSYKFQLGFVIFNMLLLCRKFGFDILLC